MNVYSCEFDGHYPVGAVAVVTAPNKATAVRLLEVELKNAGLEQEIKAKDMKLIDINKPHVTIILDGNY